MKRIAFVAATVAAVATGCATPPGPNGTYVHDTDAAKVAAIERNARANGIRVIWLRYPERRAKQTDAVPQRDEPTGG